MTNGIDTYDEDLVKVVVDVDPVPTDFEKWAKPGHFSRSLSKGPLTTTWIWNLHADVHDFDSYSTNLQDISRKIFSAHFGQLGIIFLWLSGMYFHGARFSNYETWLSNPAKIKPSAQVVWPIVGQDILNGDVGDGFRGVQITSGLFHVWRASGITNELELFSTAMGGLFMAFLMFFAGWFHYHKAAPKLRWFQNAESMLNHHLAGLLGLGSLSWAGHQVHIAIPINKLLDKGVSASEIPLPHEFLIDKSQMINLFPSFEKGLMPFVTLNWKEYSDFLTFQGGLDPQTGSLWLTDIAHHHLAIAVLFIVAGHMYRTNWSIGHNLQDLVDGHNVLSQRFNHRGLYQTVNTCLNLQLALALAAVGTICSLVAQHMYSLPAYAYIARDFVTQSSLYTHHQYIAGFIMCGAFAHGTIFLITEYDPEINRGNVLAKFLENREVIISHLSWVCLFLGFHTLGLYVHNDVMLAFETPEKQILIEPIFAQYIQAAQGKSSYDFDVLLSSSISDAYTLPTQSFNKGLWLSGWLDAINNNTNSLFIEIGPGDFLVHHAIALGLHTTTLILVKGALDARGSKLMPDKKRFGYGFPCDGPGRGGTCDISAWDAFYLAMFWMLNTIGWVTFYWHWKHLGIWQGNTKQFYESSTYLMGWLRDYLWLNSSQLINGYSPLGMNALSVWSWMFLFGHLIYATGFMFLISWRGYWQELIETLVWAHDRLPIVLWSEKPVALTIVQARFVGLIHFTVGYILTYAAFLLASTTGKFG